MIEARNTHQVSRNLIIRPWLGSYLPLRYIEMWLQQNFLSMTLTPFSFCNWLFSMSVKCKLAQSGSPVIWWKFSFFSKSSINKTKFWTFTKVFSSGGNLCFWSFCYSVWGCIRVNNDRTQQEEATAENDRSRHRKHKEAGKQREDVPS